MIWVIVMATCLVNGSSRTCIATVSENSFLSLKACEIYKQTHYKYRTDCIQAWTVRKENK